MYGLSIYETELQKSIAFLLNPFFVFRNDLYVNLLYDVYTSCCTKMKQKFKLIYEIKRICPPEVLDECSRLGP